MKPSTLGRDRASQTVRPPACGSSTAWASTSNPAVSSNFSYSGVQTGVVERVPSVVADGFAVGGARIEHEHGRPGAVGGEDVEHEPLVVGAEVKEAVPGEHPIERPAKGQGAHVRDHPVLVGQALATDRDHRGRSVHPRHMKAARGHVRRDGRPRPAPEVKDLCAASEGRDEAVMPRLVVPAASSSIGFPLASMALVVIDDALR